VPVAARKLTVQDLYSAGERKQSDAM